MTMRHNIEYKNLESRNRISTLVQRSIAKLERNVRKFPPDVVFLRISIEENTTRTLYHVAITLDVPRKTLATKEGGHDTEVAIKKAFAEIERQLKEHKSRL